MSTKQNGSDMVLRCAARQDVDAPNLSAVEEAAGLEPRPDQQEQAWIASKAATQERLGEPEVVTADAPAPAIP